MISDSQTFLLLFLMLGPFKILGPFVKITKNADPVLSRKIALRAILFSVGALFIAAFLGENIMKNYGIPVPILALSAGIILFLVALLNILSQFITKEKHEEVAGSPSLTCCNESARISHYCYSIWHCCSHRTYCAQD
jgi:multiple antibiotic resistance protein